MANYSSKPSKLEVAGNGAYIYRFNIVEKTQDEPQAQSENNSSDSVRTSWDCDEVVVYAPLTANKIVEAVIEEKWDASYEQKLINEYNGAELGLYGGSSTSDAAKVKKANYKSFLQDRTAIKENVDADCAELGIF